MTDDTGTLDDLPPLSLPPVPPDPPRAAFPWIASAAPVAGSLAIWAITGSVLSLAFAALGPLVAVAALLDARRSARRAGRERRRDRTDALVRLRAEVARRHGIERAAAWRATPPTTSLVARSLPSWLSGLPDLVLVGAGHGRSRVSVQGAADDPEAERLVGDAARLADAPVRVATGGGIGFVGPPALARAAARAAILQCADAADPETSLIAGPGGHWDWLDLLPHRATGARSGRLRVVEGPGEVEVATPPGPGVREGDGAVVVFAIASAPASLPPGLGTVVEVAAPRRAIVRRNGREPRTIRPELVSEAEARATAQRFARIAVRAGLASSATVPPSAVALADLIAEPAAGGSRTDRSSLAVAVGAGGAGPMELDLVAGPHAMIAGTSGSGKSEFLVAWVGAMAARYAPDRVAFLLVDFKGGAAFEPVRDLPHLAGLVTDLDEDEAERAVASIRAELRHRERVLASAGVRGIAELPDGVVLPRLVVVVDEFQAMIERFGELGAVVSDVAARGRSLGVHLVLAAQRPNGVVREQVSANCGLRVSLRVLERADSVAVVGVDAAAALDPARPGRAVVDRGDGRIVEFQSALADRATIESIAVRHPAVARPRRPWLDPLPTRIDLDGLEGVLASSSSGPDSSPSSGPGDSHPRSGEALALGVVDEPESQRRTVARWTPAVDGPLLLLGAPGSGRSALLEAVAMQVARRHGTAAVARLEGPRSQVWDTLALLADASGRGSEVRLVLIDDIDIRFAGWPDGHRVAALAAVEQLLRAAREGGPAVALSASRASGLGSGIRDSTTVHVLLRHPSRGDLVHAGGDGGLHRAGAPPGSGQWNGHRAQFLHAERSTAPGDRLEAPPLAWPDGGVVAVSSARPVADADAVERLVAAAEVIRLSDGSEASGRAQHAFETGSGVVVGGAEDWAANWSLAAAARARADLVVHGGAAEYRALVREPALPPLLDDDRDQCWRIRRGGPSERFAWTAVDDGFRSSMPRTGTESVSVPRRN
jgi:DNA segregation ATPase FtsK/SpoIIIE, S-DNA-T family